jgi:hypothetical protein
MIEVDGREIDPGLVMRKESFMHRRDGSLVKCEKDCVPQRFHVYVIDRETGNVLDEVYFSNNFYAEAFVYGMEKRGYAQTEKHAGIKPEEAQNA